MEFGKRIGRRIGALRRLAGLSQAGLAERLGPEVAVGTVSRWERGSMTPPVAVIERISVALGVTVDEFFAGVIITKGQVAEPAEWAAIRDVLMGLSPGQVHFARELLGVYVAAVREGR